jgi:hypothetical protein
MMKKKRSGRRTADDERHEEDREGKGMQRQRNS